MANHVNSYLKLEQISEEGLKVWNALVEKLYSHEPVHGEYHLGHFISNEPDLSDIDRSTMTDFCGAKWAYAHDADEGGMSIQSAWSPVREFVTWVAQKIGEVDPNVIIQYTYEDEMPNFIGAEVYIAEGMEDGVEDSWDEILETLLESHDDLRQVWDAEEEEWKDDGELIHEYLWDYIDTWQYRQVSDMTNFIVENRT